MVHDSLGPVQPHAQITASTLEGPHSNKFLTCSQIFFLPSLSAQDQTRSASVYGRLMPMERSLFLCTFCIEANAVYNMLHLFQGWLTDPKLTCQRFIDFVQVQNGSLILDVSTQWHHNLLSMALSYIQIRFLSRSFFLIP